jgi:hypothetical protein
MFNFKSSDFCCKSVLSFSNWLFAQFNFWYFRNRFFYNQNFSQHESRKPCRTQNLKLMLCLSLTYSFIWSRVDFPIHLFVLGSNIGMKFSTKTNPDVLKFNIWCTTGDWQYKIKQLASNLLWIIICNIKVIRIYNEAEIMSSLPTETDLKHSKATKRLKRYFRLI